VVPAAAICRADIGNKIWCLTPKLISGIESFDAEVATRQIDTLALLLDELM